MCVRIHTSQTADVQVVRFRRGDDAAALAAFVVRTVPLKNELRRGRQPPGCYGLGSTSSLLLLIGPDGKPCIAGIPCRIPLLQELVQLSQQSPLRLPPKSRHPLTVLMISILSVISIKNFFMAFPSAMNPSNRTSN